MILSIDQGTTGTTVLLMDEDLRLRGREGQEFPQHYPQPGWVEHDPEEIWTSCLRAIEGAFVSGGVSANDVSAIGITNQRETVMLWDRTTGRPLQHALVWQDRRTAPMCDRLRQEGRTEWLHARTGLLPDPYFSATKLAWLLGHDPEWRVRAERGELAAGTVDTWLLWKLTGGRVHATDPTNASRTLLYSLRDLRWDPELLDLFHIPEAILPEVKPSSGLFGETAPESGLPRGIPITGVAGDQQAALYGQRCFGPGDAKCTYGTGAFLLVITGGEPVLSNPHLLATVACGKPEGRESPVNYALEGSVFICGAVMQWLRDGLGLITVAAESEMLARSVPDTGGVYFVPAFVGLGAPYWDADARGLICGITRGTTRAHLVRAGLEAMAYQVADLVAEMMQTSGISLPSLRVDGGASTNDWLMEFQSGVLGIPVERPRLIETTGVGAALLAGLGAGIWPSEAAIPQPSAPVTRYEPMMSEEDRGRLLEGWRGAVARARSASP
ncbi:MAG: glycerol kinase GlpK [Armatimonadetes bacterium]|nr:glycerol kinase GlpK [Armatimonadota bacterium]